MVRDPLRVGTAVAVAVSVVAVLLGAAYVSLSPMRVPGPTNPSTPTPNPPASSPPSTNSTPPSQNTTSPPSGNGSSSSPAENKTTSDLVLKATTDAATYVPGESVTINITVTNVGNETENLTFPEGTCPFDFEVRNATGSALYDYLRHVMCGNIVITDHLGRGQSFSYRLVWTQVEDSGVHVPAPARYEIVPAMNGGNDDIPVVVPAVIDIA